MRRFKHIFILSAGRVGSTSIVKACQHISNYSTAHESNNRGDVVKRLSYPAYHIESDNRLSWMLGSLHSKYPQDTFYVFLKRKNQVITAESHQRRACMQHNLFRHFCTGILQNHQYGTPEACFMISVIENNIEAFIQNKEHLVIELEDFEEGFIQFWNTIGAEGNLDDALSALSQKHNASISSTSFWKRKSLLKELFKTYLRVGKT